jgi:diguanylate cyclase (GGDEF)-like protein
LGPGLSLIHLLIAAAVGVGLGLLLSQLWGNPWKELEEAKRTRDLERLDAERVTVRLRRQIEDLELRAKDQGAIFQILPDLVGQMFAVKGRRGVGPLALKIVDQLFRPEQAAVFVVGNPRETGVLDEDFLARPAVKRIVLAAGHGLPQSLTQGMELEYGKGRIGYAAERREAMDDADFRALSGFARRQVEAHPQALRVDAVAPIEDEGGLLGLVAFGGPRLRQGQEKRLLKMVADLTGVALTHVTLLRQTEEAAVIDGLTGVYNKRHLQKLIGDRIHDAERYHTPLSLLIIDIDHFKHYNDTNGHLEGDGVLKKVGALLKASTREDDVAGRYGGEEFVVLFPGATKELAMRLAENLRRGIAATQFPHAVRQPLGSVTISGGVATFPEDSRNANGLIRAADQALYDAKAAGRNRIVAATTTYFT